MLTRLQALAALRPRRIYADIDVNAPRGTRLALYVTRADQRSNRPDLTPIKGVFVPVSNDALGAEINRIALLRLEFEVGEAQAAEEYRQRTRRWRDSVQEVQFVVMKLVAPAIRSPA